MKKKRPTPRKLPSGNWNCVVMVDGVRHSITHRDKEICQAKAMAVQSGLMQKEEKKSKITLEKAIDSYLQIKSQVLSPSTIVGYEAVKNERFKGLMQRDIYSITKKDLQFAVNQECTIKSERTGRFLSPKTVMNAFGLIRPVLKSYGIDASDIILPQTIKKDRGYVQADEIAKLIDVIRGDLCEVQILMALWLGMRRSEIMGLHWDCVDYKHKWLVIKRTLVLNKDKEWVLKDGAKNRSSQRKVKCPDYILDKLKEKQNGRTEGPCFTNHPNTILKRLQRACELAGVTDTTVHGLRHTNAAVMRSIGISDAHAMERGGWLQENTYKNTYSYVFESNSEREDDLIDGYFESKITNEITNGKT